LCSGKRNHSTKITRRCRCVFRYHGGPTPVAGRKRPQLQLRYSHPRRADARRSWERAFVHRTNRFFPDKCLHCTKSGGRKPPVEGTPQASSRARNSLHCRCRRGLQNHGGLTPAALVNVRSYIAKIVILSADGRRNRTQSGGRKPPVVRYCDSTGVREHTVGSLPRLCGSAPAGALRQHPQRADARRSCSCVARSPNIAWFPRNSARFTGPRRADTRRSCEPAFVHRKNRFLPANVRTATRAGGVSPPWDVIGMRTRNAEIQRVAVATVVSDQGRADAGRWKKASAIAMALPHHGGLTLAALVNVRSCIAQIVFRRQTFALQQERGA